MRMLTECFKTGAFDHSATRPAESTMVVQPGPQAQERSFDIAMPHCVYSEFSNPNSAMVLLTPQRGNEAARPTMVAVFAEIDALPGAEAGEAVLDGDRERTAQ